MGVLVFVLVDNDDEDGLFDGGGVCRTWDVALVGVAVVVAVDAWPVTAEPVLLDRMGTIESYNSWSHI